MPAATAEHDGDTLRVRGELDFDSAADLWAISEATLQAESIRWIDLSGVQRSNSAGVALLVEWLHQARRRRRKLAFINIPAQMRAIIAIAGLDAILPPA
jgi:phospholipid transport system transporter-binding protein